MRTNDIMAFRTAYLRLVARTWMDPSYAKRVVDYSPAELIKRFEDQYDFKWPWPALDFRLAAGGAEWRPQRTGGWRGKDFSGELIVKLPLNKGCIRSENPEKHFALALADFYALRSSVFGCKVQSGPAVQPERSTAVEHDIGTHIGMAMPIHLGVGEERFLEFSAVLLRALALAWDDEEFKDHLLLPTSCLPALAGWLGYNSPWNIRIVVKNDYDAVWKEPTPERLNGWLAEPTAQESSGNQGGTTLSKNLLILELPQCPYEGDAADDVAMLRPIALAAYNVTGPAYPFTCTA